MDAFGQNHRREKKVFGERELLDQALIGNQGDGRGTDGSGKPGPWKQPGKKKKRELLILDFEHNRESDVKDQGKEEWIQERPQDSKPCPLVLKGDLVLRQNPQKIDISPGIRH